MEQDLNKKWTDRKLIEEIIKSMNLHSEPSQETKKRLELLENSHNKTMEKIDSIINTLGEMKVCIAEMPEKIFDKADERYISKKMAVVIISFAVLVSGSFIGLGIFSLKSMIKNEISETSVTKSEMQKSIQEVVVQTLEDKIEKANYAN
jgi:hypothetical protein